MARGFKKKFTGFELFVLLAIILVLVSVLVRVFIVWNYDWSIDALKAITLKEWLISFALIAGYIALTFQRK